jgi:hypothetical protein
MLPDLSASSWPVRAFYKAWALNPYFGRGKFGGLFALSPNGAARVFPLPAVTADDEWVRRAFEAQDISFVPESRFVAKAPQDVATLIRLRRRSLRGARAVRSAVGHNQSEGSAKAMLRHAAPRPSLWLPMAIYIAVMLLVRLQLRLEPASAKTLWERDTANRSVANHSVGAPSE